MIRKRLAAGLLAATSLAALVLTLLQPAISTAAQREPSLAPGLGIWLDHSDFVGFYVAQVDGTPTKVYCIRPDNAAPTAISLRTLSRLPDTSAEVTRLLAETLAAHGDAHSRIQAAAVSQALNSEIGNRHAVHRRAVSLPERVHEIAHRYVAEAHALAGRYRLAVDLPRSPLPGQSARGTVTLTSTAGPAPGVVSLRHTDNVTTPDAVRVRADGSAHFTYTTTAGGPVHIWATADVAPTTVLASRPAADTQVMVAASPPVEVGASSSYQGTAPGITYRYNCSSECDGHPLVTLRACAPANQRGSRITFGLAAGTIRRLYFAAATDRQCKSIDVTLADRTSVRAFWQYREHRGWTGSFAAGGSFVVDCPAPPPVAIALTHDCTHARVVTTLGTFRHGSLRPFRNRSAHRVVLVVSGAVSGRYVVSPHETATLHAFHIACGAGAVVSARSGVQRTGGDYNYGDPVAITVP